MQVYFGDNPELDKSIQVNFGTIRNEIKAYRYTLATTQYELNHTGILWLQPGMV